MPVPNAMTPNPSQIQSTSGLMMISSGATCEATVAGSLDGITT